MLLTIFGFMRDEVRVRPAKYRNEEGDYVIVVAHMNRACNAYLEDEYYVQNYGRYASWKETAWST